MSNDPEEIRRQIEATRAGLSDDVNALSDKVSPGQIAKRQRDKLMGTAQSVKDSIMGSAEMMRKSSASEAMSTVGDAVSGAPSAVANGIERQPARGRTGGLRRRAARLLVVPRIAPRSAGRGQRSRSRLSPSSTR